MVDDKLERPWPPGRPPRWLRVALFILFYTAFAVGLTCAAYYYYGW